MIRNSKRTLVAFPIITLLLLAPAPWLRADAETGQPTQAEKDVTASPLLLAMNKAKAAVPPAPGGWTVSGETRIDPQPSSASGTRGNVRFTYAINYRRVVGVKEEKKRLNEAYVESSTKHQDAAKPLIEELIKQQTATSLKLRKATRRRDRAEEQRLNEELEEHGRKMRTVHEETDLKIGKDVEPFLVKDAEASIRISVNDDRAEFQAGGPITVPGAAFAVRREGERTGATGWKEGQTWVLFGNWQQERNNVFLAKAQTITIAITGDKKRTEALLRQMDIKALLKLIK